jgi:purine nucleosidase
MNRDVPRMVLDTDANNEVDDQFAIVHALLSPDRVQLEALYAAPFHNERSDGPADGMRKSYAEIGRIVELVGNTTPPVFKGAEKWLTDSAKPQGSAASEDLIERALSSNAKALYVVAIGAPTNVSTALLMAPEIAERIVVVWLGGNSLHWATAREFNLYQDLRASQHLFDSGVPLVHVPCIGVADRLATTLDEIEHYVRPCGAIGDFLASRYAAWVDHVPGRSKVIWDLAAVGWLLDPTWTTTEQQRSPILTSELTWSDGVGRHKIREVIAVDRDAIFGDLFGRLRVGADQAEPRVM